MKTFNGDFINAEDIDLMQPYMNHDKYNEQAASFSCKNLTGVLVWTKAMVKFYNVNKDVIPLKSNLAIQNRRNERAQKKLEAAMKLLEAKEKEAGEATRQKQEAEEKERAAKAEFDAIQNKMNQAVALIDGLAGENIRWTEQSKQFKSETERLVGDIIVLTGFLSYTGPFNQEFRNNLLKQWHLDVVSRKIPISANINIIDSLVDSATIGEWNLQGLPNDDLSVQNGIIVTKASRYPLLIDPQSQGKLWVKQKEKMFNLRTTTLNDRNFRNILEDCVSLGYSMLIEDIGEELDPVRFIYLKAICLEFYLNALYILGVR